MRAIRLTDTTAAPAHNADTDDHALDFLARLAALPAMAFHADTVAAVVRDILAEIGIGWRADSFGNLIARIPGVSANADSVPLIVFMAHMDHPGFEVGGRDRDYLVGRVPGGVPPGTFAPGVRRQIILPDGRRIAVATAGQYDAATGAAPAPRHVLLQLYAPSVRPGRR